MSGLYVAEPKLVGSTITGKTLVTAAVGDSVLISDLSDSGNLKKVTVQTIVDLASNVPTLITVANESTDQTCFPAFFNAVTGDLAPKTNTGLTFNALTGALGAASFVGPLTGNASTVTTNANLTGHVTSVGNAAVLGSFTKAQLDAAVSDDNVAYLGQAQTFVGNQAVTGNITASGTGTFGPGTGLQYFYLNGGNSGTTTGAAIRVQNGGVDIGLIGNRSSIMGGAYDNAFLLHSNNALQVNVGGATLPIVKITTGGLVGIGVGANTPANTLELGDGTGLRYLAFNGANSGTTTGCALRFLNGGVDFAAIGNYSAVAGGAYIANLLINSTSTPIILAIGLAEKVRVSTTGVDVTGNITASGTTLNTTSETDVLIKNGGDPSIVFNATSFTNHAWKIKQSADTFYIQHATAQPFSGTVLSCLSIGPTGNITASGTVTTPSVVMGNWTLTHGAITTGTVSLTNSVSGAVGLQISQAGTTKLLGNLYINSSTANEAGIVLVQSGVDKWQLYDSGGAFKLYNYTTNTERININGATGALTYTGNITASGTGTLGIYTVATLPAASSNAYAEANVSDALAPVMGSTVTNGGSVKTKVRSNGTNWTVCGI